MAEQATITRVQARTALEALSEAIKVVRSGLEAAPFQSAVRAINTIDSLEEHIAGELGLEVVGRCEGCQLAIFDGDKHTLSLDGCWLCADCGPSDEDLARLRSIQSNCPKGDPECCAQTADDHDACLAKAKADE